MENLYRSEIDGNGACARAGRAFARGEVIRVMATKRRKGPWEAAEGAVIMEEATRTSIQIDRAGQVHVEDLMGQFVNHSSHPNTEIIEGQIVATRPIQPDEEVTFDYNKTESVVSHPFEDVATGLMVRGSTFEK